MTSNQKSIHRMLTALKQEPPIDSNLLEFAFPPVKERTLANGLRLLIIERPELPKVYLRLGMDFGIKNDPSGKSGLCQMLGSTLKKGTSSRQYDEIVDRIEGAGGELDAMVNQDFFIVYGEILKENLAVGLELLSDISLHPLFPETEVEKERAKLVADLENEKSSPHFLAYRRMDKAIYGNHPYSAHKSMESLHNIARDDLLEFHDKYFNPEGSFLVMAGDITESEAAEAAQSWFSNWERREAATNGVTMPQPAGQRTVYLVDRPGSEQVNILLGNLLFDRHHPDYEKMLVANKILGGGGSGRLFLYLREEKGFTYGAYSVLQAYRDTGAWLANAEVRPEVLTEAITGFFEQFEKIQTEAVSDEELRKASRYLIGVFPLQNETPASIAALALQQRLYRLPLEYWDFYLSSIGAVTPQDVRAVAQKYIIPDEMAIVVVGDAKSLKEGLTGFGEVQVFDLEDRRIS